MADEKILTSATGRPVGTKPLTEPPPAGTYRYVLRRLDRRPTNTRLNVGYGRGTIVPRAITFGGVTAETVFLPDRGAMKLARKRGYRFDITDQWFAALRRSPTTAAASLDGLKKDQLVALARQRGLAVDGTKAELLARLKA